jgi:alpha-galactosidase
MSPKIVLIGAGSAQFGFDTLGDVFQSEVLKGCEITLHDINPDSLQKVLEAGQAFVDEHGLSHRLNATTDREKALKDADFCIISIEVGDRFKLWGQDRHIPQLFGIRQVFGENGGPGGLFHSLRIIPPILDICADIERICPDAVVFNYSNPMSRICTTVCRRFPDLKFVGLCHEIASLKWIVPGILGRPYEEMKLRAGGLNHFSVVLSATDKASGEDLYPDLLAKTPAFLDTLPGLGELAAYHKEHGEWPESPEPFEVSPDRKIWPEREIFRVLIDQFRVFPITTDSHLGEYIQWAHDAADLQGIIDFYTTYKEYLMVSEPEIKMELAERVVPIMEGIITDTGYEEDAVNVPNEGIFPDLPDWLVVEVPAIIGKDGVKGISPGEMPKGFGGLLANQIAVHDLTAETVLTGSKEALKQALLADPVVDIYRNLDQMIETLLTEQREYLGYIS